MKNFIKVVVLILLIQLLHCKYNVIFAEKPLTIPALMDWKDGAGEFIFNSKSRIVIDKNYFNKLLPDAQTFKEDLKNLKGFEIEIISDTQTNAGDIFLTLGTEDTEIGNEGYILTVNDKLIITANKETGVFYATRTILQLLKNTNHIKAGIARDWPFYKERGLMLDNGRKYFSVKWIENHIKELAYLKMNIFHFHLSHDNGYRLECSSYPEITSKEFYTKAEISKLVELSNKYHVILVPEIDMPGHMGAILEKFQNTLAVKDKDGGIWGGMLDITKDEARLFAKNIIEEYIDLFTGPYWHLGADESLIDDFTKFPQFLEFAKKHYGNDAEPKDAIFDFINWTDSLVKAHGKTMRMWDDYLCLDLKNKSTIKINNDIIIEFWICDLTPKNQTQELLDLGYSLVNCNIDILYYSFSQGWKWQNTPLYENWEPNIFEYNRVVPKDHPGVLGSKLHIWCDYPDYETEGHVTYAVKTALRVVSQKFWGSPKLEPLFSKFQKIVDTLGIAPGIEYPENPMPDNLVFRKKVVASSTEKNSNFIPEQAIDGSYDTKWSSEHTEKEWIYVDLEKSYNITRVKMNWSEAYPVNYQIQVSNDTLKWKTIFSTDNGHIGITDLTTLSGNGRYVRIYCSKRLNDTIGYSLWEFEIYDSLLISSVNPEFGDKSNGILTCYPNPANSYLNINYTVDTPNFIKLSLFNLNGQEVEVLEQSFKFEGKYEFKFNTIKYPANEYLCCLYIGNKIITRKMIITK